MASNIKLKKSSVPGRVPNTGDLDYGEVAINFADGRLYYKTTNNTIDYFLSDSASAAVTFDSADVIQLIDSDYINLRVIQGTDSASVISLIDSAYINERTDGPTAAEVSALMNAIDNNIIPALDAIYDLGDSNNRFRDLYLSDSSIIFGETAFINAAKINLIPPVLLDSAIIKNIFSASGDLSYNSGTGEFSFTQTANIDSSAVIGLVDSAYVAARQSGDADTLDGQQGTYYLDYTNFTNTPNVLDSVNITNLIDSDYINARVAANIDSAAVVGLVDSAYVQARQITYNTSNFTDSAFVTGLPVSTFTNDANYLDSTTVTGVIDAAYIQANQTTYDFLDSSEVTSLIDSAYINARVGANIDSGAVIGLVDSAYVQSRQLTYDFLDSSETIALIDSAYVQARQITYDFLDSTGALGLFSGGTGVTVNSGVISIAQAVDSTADVYFNTIDVSGNVIVGGNLQVNGTTTTVDTQNLSVTDNMIYLNAGESAGSPTAAIDIGFAGNYNDDGSYAHTGFFRDATDNTFKVFDGYTPEPDASVEINTGHASFALAPFAASTLTGTLLGLDSDLRDSSYVIDGDGSTGGVTISDGGIEVRTSTGNPSFLDLYCEVSNAHRTRVKSDAHANYSGNVDLTLPVTTGTLALTSDITSTIDSAYINARVDAVTGTDSAAVITLIQANSIDSTGVIGLVDSAYVQARQSTTAGTDSATVLALIDSAYIQSIVTSVVGADTVQNFFRFTADSGQTVFTGADNSGDTLAYNTSHVSVFLNGILLADSDDYTASNGTSITLFDSAALNDDVYIVTSTAPLTTSLDSADIISLVDSAYVQARVSLSAGTDSATVISLVQANSVDSAEVLSLIDSAYVTARVGSVTGTDSASVIALIDSDYVASRAYTPTEFVSSTTYAVTVGTKTSAHMYFGQGSTEAYFLDGREAPFIQMIPGQTYVFDQSDASNTSHPLRFYYESDKTTQFTASVTSTGTPGSAGASTTIVVGDATPARLYYQCQFHSLMGWGVGTHTHNLSGLNTDDLSEGSLNQYFTTARARSAISNGTGVTISNGTISIGQPVGTTDNVTFNNLVLNGNLTVSGTTTTVNTETISLADNIIELNSNQDGGTLPSQNAGLLINRGSVDDIEFRWNETSDYWELSVLDSNAATPSYHKILTQADSGTLDALTLAGRAASYYTTYANISGTPTSITDLGIADGNSGQILATDGSGNFYFTTVSGSGSSGTASLGMDEFKYTATGGAAFGTATSTYQKVQVFVNGILATDSADYAFNDSSGQITFTTAPETNSEVKIYGFRGSFLERHELLTVDSDANLTVSGDITVGNHSRTSSGTTTLAADSDGTIDTFDKTVVRGAKYVVTVENDSDRYQISEVLLIHDGTTATVTTYGTINTGSGNLAVFDATIDSGSNLVKLLASPTTVNTVYKVVRNDVLI